MMAMMPTLGLKNFTEVIEQTGLYPFYGVILYTPTNGLDRRIHEYVQNHWNLLNRLTGDSCLLFAVEDIERGPNIDEFKPEEVYDIARLLGVSVKDLPCVVFFVEPRTRKETLILKMGELFEDSVDLTDETITRFFRVLQSVVDKCADDVSESRLNCLNEGIVREVSKDSTWAVLSRRISTTAEWLVASTTASATLLVAISKIVQAVTAIGG